MCHVVAEGGRVEYDVAPRESFRSGELCVTKRRSSWACIGNPKLEQETIEGTHAQETPAYQRRPTTLHEVQGGNPPIRALYMQLAKIPHTHHSTPCATIAPGADKPARHPLRAQQAPAQRTHNKKRGAGATPRRPKARLDTEALARQAGPGQNIEQRLIDAKAKTQAHARARSVPPQQVSVPVAVSTP